MNYTCITIQPLTNLILLITIIIVACNLPCGLSYIACMGIHNLHSLSMVQHTYVIHKRQHLSQNYVSQTTSKNQFCELKGPIWSNRNYNYIHHFCCYCHNKNVIILASNHNNRATYNYILILLALTPLN